MNRAVTGSLSRANAQDYLVHFVRSRVISENTLRQGFAPAEVRPNAGLPKGASRSVHYHAGTFSPPAGNKQRHQR